MRRLSGEPLNAPANGELAATARGAACSASNERVGGGGASSASVMVAPIIAARCACGVACWDGMLCSSELANSPAPATTSEPTATAVRGQRGRCVAFVDAVRASSAIVIRPRTPA